MSAPTKTIVLLPGFMLDDTLWDDFVPHLPPDWNVQRISLPRGRTVHEVAHGLADRLSGPAAVVGFSMGGYVARALAVAHPHLVEALVLVATSARRERPAAPRSGAAANASFAGLSRRAIQSSLSHDRADDQPLIERVRAMGVRLGGDVFAWQSALDRTDAPLEASRARRWSSAPGRTSFDRSMRPASWPTRSRAHDWRSSRERAT